MHCTRLAAANFRNYIRLDLSLPPGSSVIVGDNAQGKSNLLEAIYLLATTRSFRASVDRELVSWRELTSDLPFARLSATVQRRAGEVHVEAIISVAPSQIGSLAESAPTGKRLRVNGIPKRSVDYLGAINVVMFSPRDIELVDGPPAQRRRYLDVTICQVEPAYVRALARYNKIVIQRNALLRQIRDGRARVESLAPWDQELVAAGAYITRQRESTIAQLAAFARERYHELTGRQEVLEIVYRPSVEASDAEPTLPGFRPSRTGALPSAIEDTYRRQLRATQRRDIAAGVCCLGPHRDDLAFFSLDRDVALYGSRGQQRTVALALKLAEAEFLRQRTGEQPILLLDDVLSELDEHRREYVLGSIAPDQQVLLTATDLSDFSAGFLAGAAVYHVREGIIDLVSPAGRAAGARAESA